MDTITNKTSETEEREAVARLTNMRTHEVSLVDLAANLRRFLLVKRGAMDPETTTKETEPEGAEGTGTNNNEQSSDPTEEQTKDEAAEAAKSVMMPSAAKQTLMDGLAGVLERLTGLAQVVGEAEIDDEAPVPEDVVQMISDVGMMLGGLRDQFAAPEQTEAAQESTEDETETEAAAESDEQTKGEESAEEPEAKATEDETEKAGRKIAGRRLKKLETLAEQLTAIIRELGGLDEPTKKSDEDNDETEHESDPIADALGALAKSVETICDRVGAVEETIAKASEKAEADDDEIAKANEAIAKLSAQLQAPGDSNVREVEGNNNNRQVEWANDMAEEVRRKRGNRATS